LLGNYRPSDISDRRGAEEYAKDLFERTPQDGILFCGSDNSMFPSFYLHYVEGYRPDCRVYGHLPTLTKLRRDLGLENTPGSWNKFPELLKHLIESNHPPLVFAREPMQITNDFHEIIGSLKSDGLVSYLDSLQPPRQSTSDHFDWRRVPPLYDPKESAMYAVYYLTHAGTAAQANDPEATTLMKTAVDLIEHTDNAVMMEALASYFVINDSLSQAKSLIEKTLKMPEVRYGERLRLLLPLGKIDLRLGDVQNAEKILSQVVEADPGNRDAQFHLLSVRSATLAGEKKWQEAIDTYLQMQALAPEQREVDFQLGLLYIQLGDAVNARKRLEICTNAGYKTEQVTKLMQLMGRDNPMQNLKIPSKN
jgi:hypothetical protein